MAWRPTLRQLLPTALFVHGITILKMLNMISHNGNQTFHLSYLKEITEESQTKAQIPSSMISTLN